MKQKLLCFGAIFALLFVFATANVASADEAAAPAAGCPCGLAAAPCHCGHCCPPVTYRVGLFGALRPVVCAPACAPVVCAPTVCAPVVRPLCVRPVYTPARCVYPTTCFPYRACPPYYAW